MELSQELFQSAPPHGGRLADFNIAHRLVMFQSAPPHGGRPRCGDCFRRARRFNPRPRTGGDLSARLRNVDIMTFQSAPPHGGRHETVLVLGLIRLFQSAPPHGGRRAEDRARDDWKCVSIRAPARGATHRYVPYDRVMGFQSAPPHGGRQGRSAASLCGRSFNPRPRTGGDSVRRSRWPGFSVSIRAPARGATGRGCSMVSSNQVSIRAPARGATWSSIVSVNVDMFQSAPPHGGRHQPGEPSAPVTVSIRAPARGATFGSNDMAEHRQFQSAPPHGGRHGRTCRDCRNRSVSIRAPARGATSVDGPWSLSLCVSIRAPARGAT